ncbi:hypothetical protein DFH11DRAFT_11532 [Phellopilus nigrolimitatus]|nr:hypothetical protein DFH11DRAFT_11532 [Phellopilus nigrolimitatus]
MDSKGFPAPQRGASLMLAFRMDAKLADCRLESTCCHKSVQRARTGSAVTILANGGIRAACEELAWRAENNQLKIIEFDELAGPSDLYLSCISRLHHRHASQLGHLVFAFSISATQIYYACRKRNIPVNVTDMPSLCDFTVCATHRCVWTRRLEGKHFFKLSSCCRDEWSWV